MAERTSSFRGVALSIGSSSLFAAMYYWATLLKPLSGAEVFGWRALLTFPCVTVFMAWGGEWQRVLGLIARMRRAPLLALGLCLSSVLLGLQQWLFLWAPINGKGLEVSMGYFLLPLTMALVGRVVYGERLSHLQNIAALCAAGGVAHELYRVGDLSWATVLVAAGFPMYFVLRRRLRVDHLGGLWFDMLLMLPLAGWFALEGNTAEQFRLFPQLYPLLALLAVISSAAFMSWTSAARVLPFGVFGLLGYVEPVLMVGVALMIGERIQPEEWPTHLPIWGAVLLLMLDGVLHARRAEVACCPGSQPDRCP